MNEFKNVIMAEYPETERPAAPADATALAIPPPPHGHPSPFEEQWGIRFSDIALSGSGNVLALQYMIVAPEKTASLADEQNTPFICDQASGAKVMLCVPRHKTLSYADHSRARSMALMASVAGGFPSAPDNEVAGKTYSLCAANPELAMKPGSRVVVMASGHMSDILSVD
jgi:hypothetical protein